MAAEIMLDVKIFCISNSIVLTSISSQNDTQWAQNADFWKFHDILQNEIKLIFYIHGSKNIVGWM